MVDLGGRGLLMTAPLWHHIGTGGLMAGCKAQLVDAVDFICELRLSGFHSINIVLEPALKKRTENYTQYNIRPLSK